MPTTCDIELRNNDDSDTFYAGQELCGTVRLTLTEEKHLRGVYIQIDGKGFFQWQSGRFTYLRKAKYLEEKLYLVGGENGECIFVSNIRESESAVVLSRFNVLISMQLNQLDNVLLKPKTYTYNFRCPLPPQLPGSVKGTDGYIKYHVRVILASFSIFRNKKFEKKFRVVRPLNLNEFFALRVTVCHFCSYFCLSSSS